MPCSIVSVVYNVVFQCVVTVRASGKKVCTARFGHVKVHDGSGQRPESRESPDVQIRGLDHGGVPSV